MQDLNLRPSAPKADAIPSYANSGGFDVTCSWSGIRDLHSFSKLGGITSYYIDEYRIVW